VEPGLYAGLPACSGVGARGGLTRTGTTRRTRLPIMRTTGPIR
jgi:hypothetical protein